MEKKITLNFRAGSLNEGIDVDEDTPIIDSLTFNVRLKDHEDLMNTMEPKNKLIYFKRFLKNTVIHEDKEKLDQYIAQGMAANLGPMLMNAFLPDVEITVKK